MKELRDFSPLRIYRPPARVLIQFLWLTVPTMSLQVGLITNLTSLIQLLFLINLLAPPTQPSWVALDDQVSTAVFSLRCACVLENMMDAEYKKAD